MLYFRETNTTLQIITALKKNGCKNNHISEFIKVQLSKLLKHILHQMKKIHFCDFLKLSHKLKFSNSFLMSEIGTP